MKGAVESRFFQAFSEMDLRGYGKSYPKWRFLSAILIMDFQKAPTVRNMLNLR